MFEDYLPEFHDNILHSGDCECEICKKKWEHMDKSIKKLQKDTKKIVKEEAHLLKEDKKHDKIIDKAKKKMKGKC